MYHFGCGVNNIHFLEDGGSIIGDEGFSFGVFDHFVHASWSEAGANTIGNSFHLCKNQPLAAWMFVVLTSFVFSFLL